MSVKIHHGPHGSYKTSGAVHDDLIPAIKEGRPIVTNLRGITLDRIYDAIPDAPTNLELHYINTGTFEGLQKAQRFFHWCPPNSFLFFDEAQIVFPKSWRDSDLKALDYPGGFDKAVEEGRPPTWHHAWDMERHFNFDMILTTPNIKKIREDIRQNAEGAFKHKNNAIYGWLFRGSYIEGFHFADDNGVSASDFQSIVKKRIKPNDPTWKLYDSTATGAHRDTKAGINLLASPRLIIPLALLAAVIVFVFSRPLPAVLTGKHATPVPAQTLPNNPPLSVPAATTTAFSHDLHSVGLSKAVLTPREQQQDKAHPFEGSDFRLVGIIEKRGEKLAYFTVDGVFMSAKEMADLGYTFSYLTGCAVAIHHGRAHLLVTCNSQPERSEAEAERRPGGEGHPIEPQPPMNVAELPNPQPVPSTFSVNAPSHP